MTSQDRKIRIELAPMDGITDLPFRSVCKRYGATHLTTELIPAIPFFFNLPQSKLKKFWLKAEFSIQQRPLTVQLFGSDPKHLSKAVNLFSRMNPDAFELNAGCPSKKVTKSNSGSSLLKDLPNLNNCLKSIMENTTLPVSVKIRLGWERDSSEEIVTSLQNLPLDCIKVHGRLVKQKFKGQANWSSISNLVQISKIPIIGNGDIDSLKIAKKRIDETSVAGVQIGRAARGNPWVFCDRNISIEEKQDVILDHAGLMQDFYGQSHGIILMRKHLLWYLRNFPGARLLRGKAARVENYADVKLIVINIKRINY